MANFSTALRRLLCVGALALCTAFSSVPTPRITDWQSFRAAVIEEVQHANTSFPANVTGKQVEEVALRMWTFINTSTGTDRRHLASTSTDPDLASLAKLLEYLTRKITAFYGVEAWEKVERSCGLTKEECRTLVIDKKNTCFMRQLCVVVSARFFAVLTHFPCGLACPVGSKLPDGNQRFLVRADTEEDCNLLSRWYGCGTSCEQVAGSGDDSVYVRGLLDGLGGGFQQKFFTTCPESTACNGCPDINNLGGPNGDDSLIQFRAKENCPWLSQCESPNKATCSLTVYRDDNGGVNGGCKASQYETETVKVGESNDNDNLRTLLDNQVTSVMMKASDSTMKCEVTLFKGNRRNRNDGDCYWKLTAPVNDFQVRTWYSKSFTGSDNKDSASAYHLQYDLGEYDSGRQNKCGRIGYESPSCNKDVDPYTNLCPTDSLCGLQDKYTCTAEPWCSTGSQYFNTYL